MSIELDGEIERLIAEEIQTGRSGSAKEFVSRAVKHFVIARELGEEYTPEEIDLMISEGLDEIERGDTIDGEEAFRQLRAYASERRRQRA